MSVDGTGSALRHQLSGQGKGKEGHGLLKSLGNTDDSKPFLEMLDDELEISCIGSSFATTPCLKRVNAQFSIPLSPRYVDFRVSVVPVF